MKKVTVLMLVALIISLVPASATDPRAQSIPTVQLQVPGAGTTGEEVTVKITITYKNCDKSSHISYVWLSENYSQPKLGYGLKITFPTKINSHSHTQLFSLKTPSLLSMTGVHLTEVREPQPL